MSIVIRPAGEAALLLEYGSTIDPEINLRVVRAARRIAEAGPAGIDDVIPAYTTVLVSFDPARVSREDLSALLREDPEVCDPSASIEEVGDTHEVPVAYGGEDGPDLDEVARQCGLSPEEVVQIHTGETYRVYFLGFTPGYPYMGELDPRIEIPRRRTPRTHVPAGSVAIAGRQTGLYPMTTPGGWSILGRTPVRLFDPSSDDPTLLHPGDSVKFHPIEGPVEAPDMKFPEFEPERPICRVVQPGLYTTLQDCGRRGYMHLGASRAGAADRHSLRRANALVGNSADAAALEMTALGPQLEFLRECRVAVAGAQTTLIVDGSAIRTADAVSVSAGSRVSFGPFESGLRAYLAVQGGFDAPIMMGSRSTDTVSGFGGIGGGAIRPGTVLGVARDTDPEVEVPEPRPPIPATPAKLRIRLTPGPQAHHFPREAREILESESFVVSTDSNRMGLRLLGERRIPHNDLGPDIISEGIVPGAVQVPGDGNPIVMGVNAQTTGGYAKIGVVAAADMHLVGQAQPGDTIRFKLARD